MEPLVSIIMPAYNAEKYIKKALASLQAQTMPLWEVLITDDCSTDKTCDVVNEMAKEDNRIRLFTFTKNQGAAAARNNSLAYANGRYIAYLDADDVWYPNKLENQISFMRDEKKFFSCTSYDVIDQNGKYLGRTVRMLDKCDYEHFLTHNLLQTIGIMIDTKYVDKKLLIMPNLRRCEDAATWLQILKAGYICYGISDALGGYRRVSGSLSSGKIDGARNIWNLYRNIEKISFSHSVYCFLRYAMLAIWKRIYHNTK